MPMRNFVRDKEGLVRLLLGIIALAAYAPVSASPAFVALLVPFLPSTSLPMALWLAGAAIVNLYVFIPYPNVQSSIFSAGLAFGAITLFLTKRLAPSSERPRADSQWQLWRRPALFVLAVASLASAMLKALPIFEPLAWALGLGLLGFALPRRKVKALSVNWANSALLAVALLLSAVCVEIGARIVFEPIVPARLGYVADPDYIYTLASNVKGVHRITDTEGDPFEYEVVLSAQGIYAHEVYGPKRADEFRIVMLGDSFTAGHGLRWEDTLGQALQTLLADEPLIKRCVVINCGVGAYGPWQERGFLKERGFPFDPDLVIHQLFTANDIHDTLLQYGRRTEAYPIWWHRRMNDYRRQELLRYRVHEWIIRRSRVYQLLSRDLPGATLPWLPNRFRFFALDTPYFPPSSPRNWVMEVNLEAWYPTLREGWELFEDDVLAIRSDCLEKAVGYFAYCIPYYVSLRDDAWEMNQVPLGPDERYVKFKDVTETEAFFERESIPYINVSSALALEKNQSDLFHHPDGHLKKAGSWIIVRGLRDYLMAEYFPKIGLVRDDASSPEG